MVSFWFTAKQNNSSIMHTWPNHRADSSADGGADRLLGAGSGVQFGHGTVGFQIYLSKNGTHKKPQIKMVCFVKYQMSLSLRFSSSDIPKRSFLCASYRYDLELPFPIHSIYLKIKNFSGVLNLMYLIIYFSRHPWPLAMTILSILLNCTISSDK